MNSVYVWYALLIYFFRKLLNINYLNRKIVLIGIIEKIARKGHTYRINFSSKSTVEPVLSDLGAFYDTFSDYYRIWSKHGTCTTDIFLCMGAN